MLDCSLLESTPHAPGVYLMLSSSAAVLYVGKAKDLNKRLSSYIHYKGADYSKTAVMLRQAKQVDTIITNTEKEALILEASLIKKHKPKYNIILRDDKSYPYIKVTVQEEWPRVFMTRRKLRDGARYFGPYSSPSAMWATLKIIGNLFPLRHCKGGTLKKRERPCLNRQIGRCLAPCTGKADRTIYMEHVAQILMLLEGRNRDLASHLQMQMHDAAERLDFERAAQIRDQLTSLGRTLEKQVISASHDKDQDIFGFARKDAAVALAILFVRKGLLTGSRRFMLADPYGDDEAIVSQALAQFYHDSSSPPKEVLLPFPLQDRELLSEILSEKGGRRVVLRHPSRGDSRRLVKLAAANAAQVFEEKEKQQTSWRNLSVTLQKTLRLERSPERIECLDISNLGGKQAVGSLISFFQGEKEPSRYRHYRIRTLDEPDDYAMMREVLHRRFQRGQEKDDLPDLLLVDGGKGQLGVVLAAAKDYEFKELLEFAGIAKERRDEGEKIYRPGRKNPILLPAHNPALLYLMRIRDEAHRYGIATHRKLRSKATITSALDGVPGIGKNKKQELLRHFGSLKKLIAADQQQLQAVKGIGPELAATLYSFFQQSE